MDWLSEERRVRATLARLPDHPRVKARLGEALLAQGRYSEGFELIEFWRQVPELRDKSGAIEIPGKPRWRGEDLAGKGLFVLSEQGFGDQIMYARFAKLAIERGARIAWSCKPEMVRLLSSLGIVAFTPRPGLSVTFDYYCPSMSLAQAMWPSLAALPSEPYIATPTPRTAVGARIGVVTRGHPRHVHDKLRSLPPDLGSELLALPGAISLLPEDTGASDFYDTASIIAGLDLVIAVDTSVAHLAGAMGKPVWILLQDRLTDWRWMSARTDSPWYPSARLYRQGAPGKWRSVVAKVKRDLVALGEGSHVVKERG